MRMSTTVTTQVQVKTVTLISTRWRYPAAAMRVGTTMRTVVDPTTVDGSSGT